MLKCVVYALFAIGALATGVLEPDGSSSFWVDSIKHQGISAFNPDSSYQVYRNIKDFGAKGDGVSDDTAAINAAISSSNRCGENCGSSTLTPALVYFPSGTYMISSPIIDLYYTQLVGDFLEIPTIKAFSNFSGVALIDADPYNAQGALWYGTTDNFYRQIRNFIIDTTSIPAATGIWGVHWPVAQATSLTNLVFTLSAESGNHHCGLFIESGSGGFMTDLIFNAGQYGMNVGNQQFTSRNLTFNGCQTAINTLWDWAWTYIGLSINNCETGINLSVSPGANQSVGSILISDSVFYNTPIAINTSTTTTSQPPTSGTLYLDNVQFNEVQTAVAEASGKVVLPGGTRVYVESWGQGHAYHGDSDQYTFVQGYFPESPIKPSDLLDNNGNWYQISMPQYAEYSTDQFVSVKSAGAKGDGVTDDTKAIQNAVNSNAGSKVIFFDAGTYLVSSTITIPENTIIVGEVWPVILASGDLFTDQSKPTPVFQVGNPGDCGNVQIVDMMFSNQGSLPGAVLVEWNINDPTRTSGLWDVHSRIGGAEGTNQLADTCLATTAVGVNQDCLGVALSLHLTSQSSAYIENMWLWTADHALDGDQSQISVYTGRGMLVESQGPVFLYGTASEHAVLYQYQLYNANNILLAMIQTETPYYQSNPPAPEPYTPLSSWSDPTFFKLWQ